MARILVVGAGPTGLTLAALLARDGLTPRLIDRALAPPDDRSRAIVIQARSLELLEDLGIADRIIAAGRLNDGANLVLPSGRRRHLRFRSEWVESRFARFVSLPQDETERILGERLAALGGTTERGVELTAIEQHARGATATLRHTDGSVERYEADWIVGCDGAHSGVRHATGLAFPGVTYPEEALLGDVDLDWSLPEGEISICPSVEGMMLAFPLPGTHRYRVIMILPARATHEDRHLELDEFSEQLARLTPGPAPVVTTARWLTRYRLHRRGVTHYRAGRCFLAGDAAHIHSPVGAQGMNTGIQDAYNLAWKLALVTREGAPDSLLDSYHDERHRVGQYLLRNTDRMFAVLAGSGRASRVLRRVAPSLALRAADLPLVGRRLTRFVSQTGIRYGHSPLSSQGPGAATLGDDAPCPGDRLPDVDLGDGRRLAPLTHGGTFTLLLFAGDAPDRREALSAVGRSIADAHAALVRACVVYTGALDGNLAGVHDAAGRAHARFGARNGAMYLVRPDGYIAFRGGPLDVEALRGSLASMLRSRPLVHA